MKKAISKINPSRYAKKLHISYIWLIAVLLLLAVGVICSGAKVYKYSPILSVVSYSLAAISLIAIIIMIVQKISDMKIQSELANILGVSAAAVSQMIAVFEKKGLLQRVHSNTDRRTVYIQIVPEAIEMFQKRMDTHVENVYRFLDYLGSEDCAHLRDILKKTARYMEENK